MELLSRKDEDKAIVLELQTSKQNNIENQQFSIITKQEESIALKVEKEFGENAKYQGFPTKKYNCHGMTFANKRTGIFDDKMIELIINDEYVEVKEKKDVQVGDVAVYYGHAGILHSALVVQKEDTLSIKVLSKVRQWKEIVHFVHFSPYKECQGLNIKFFRINHGHPTIL